MVVRCLDGGVSTYLGPGDHQVGTVRVVTHVSKTEAEVNPWLEHLLLMLPLQLT